MLKNWNVFCHHSGVWIRCVFFFVSATNSQTMTWKHTVIKAVFLSHILFFYFYNFRNIYTKKRSKEEEVAPPPRPPTAPKWNSKVVLSPSVRCKWPVKHTIAWKLYICIMSYSALLKKKKKFVIKCTRLRIYVGFVHIWEQLQWCQHAKVLTMLMFKFTILV